MRLRGPAAFRASSTWLIAGAFLMALASIAIVITLQRRANASRDSQVVLGEVQRDFDALQSTPYDVIGAQTAAARALVGRRMQVSERQIERRLADLRRSSSTPHLTHATAPYRANTALLERIRLLITRGRQGQADELGPLAGRLQRSVDVELGEAAGEFSKRASRSLTLATVGETSTIMILVSVFAVFYQRSRRAHATAQRLAEENSRLLLQDAQLQVIQRLALAAEYRDDETGQHTRRVGDLSARIGAALGMPEERLSLLRQAAPLHDVGKIGVPDSILLKPDRLTPDEFERMKSHTTLGAGMLAGGRGLALLEMAEEIALTHHERWDGHGYPAGLVGRDIPLVGRIVAVADVFDALTHERPYKSAWPLPDAVKEIGAQTGRQFDADVVAAFTRVLPDLDLSDDSNGPAADRMAALAS